MQTRRVLGSADVQDLMVGILALLCSLAIYHLILHMSCWACNRVQVDPNQAKADKVPN